MEKTTIERAIELARSGRFKTVGQIREQLDRELYSSTNDHLQGRATKLQLAALIAAAKDGQNSEDVG